MKILAWNIMAGGGTRIPKIAAVIAAHRADTVALGEVTPGRTGELRSALEDQGFLHFLPPRIPAKDRGVLIASKAAFAELPDRSDLGLPAFRWAAVRFKAEGFSLVCTYFPATTPGIRDFWPRVHEACTDLRAEAALIVGDLNSGDSVFDAERGTFVSDKWFSAMRLYGFTDLWRMKHRARIEYTWHSRRGETGFRIDHAFGSAALRRRVRSCEYSQDEREAETSDHASLLVTVR